MNKYYLYTYDWNPIVYLQRLRWSKSDFGNSLHELTSVHRYLEWSIRVESVKKDSINRGKSTWKHSYDYSGFVPCFSPFRCSRSTIDAKGVERVSSLPFAVYSHYIFPPCAYSRVQMRHLVFICIKSIATFEIWG